MRFFRLLGWKSSAEVLTRLLGLTLLILLARVFGKTGLGEYALSLAIFGLWSVALDWGTHSLITREVARAPEQAEAWFQAGCQLKLAASTLFVLGSLLIPQLYPPAPAPLLLFSAAALILGQSWVDYLVAYLNGKLAFRQEFFLRSSFRILATGAQLAALVLAFSLELILALGGGLSLAYAAAASLFYYRASRRLSRERGPSQRELIQRGWGFWLANVSWMLVLKLDLVMLPQWGASVPVVGQYQVAVRLFEMLGILAGLVSLTLFPLMAAHKTPLRELQRWLFSMSALGMGVALVPLMAAPWALPLIFGPEFAVSSELLQILCLGTPFLYQNLLWFTVLGVHDKQHWVGLATALSLGLNALLNALLIPLWQAQGAALASLSSDLALWLLLAFLARRLIPLRKRQWALNLFWATGGSLGLFVLRGLSA